MNLTPGRAVQIRHDRISEFLNKTKLPRINGKRVPYPKTTLDFNAFIKHTRSKLRYVSSGTSGHTFRGRLNLNKRPYDYAIKIVPYTKNKHYGDENNPIRPENAEVNTLWLFRHFVFQRDTPHIVCPITTFLTPMESLMKLELHNLRPSNKKKFKKFKTFVEDVKKNVYHNKVSILISEWANSGDLLSFLRSDYEKLNVEQWRSILFQVLHPIAVIHKEYPGFRHNDMKANNILMHKPMNTKGGTVNDCSFVTYRIDDTKFRVPNVGVILKMWDFDFSSTPGHVENAKVNARWCRKLNILHERNQYYDLHYFLYTLFFFKNPKPWLHNGFFKSKAPTEVKEFIKRIVPRRYRENIKGKGRTMSKDEYMTAERILKTDPFFQHLKFEATPEYGTSKSESESIECTSSTNSSTSDNDATLSSTTLST